MPSTVAACMQQLETQGFTLIERVVSARQLGGLARANRERIDFLAVRRLFDGLPMRVMEGLAGPMVLSQVRYGTPAGWHRGRTDTVASGAPAGFVPGFDVSLALDGQPCTVDAIAGSARLGAEAILPSIAGTSVTFTAEDVVVFDSRTVRRWPDPRPDTIFWYSVIRPWMMPLMDVMASVPRDAPPRALAFAGRRPSREIGEWLFSTHQGRSR